MHVALCGPATPADLAPLLHRPMKTAGYPFPLLPLLAASYCKLGMKVTIVTTGHDISEPEIAHGDQLQVIAVPARARARSRAMDLFRAERRAISQVLQRVGPDVIHAHWTYEFALGALASNAAPVLVTAHDAPFTVLKHLPDPYRFARLLMACQVRARKPVMTAVSPYLAERWRREMLYPGHMPIVPNPLPAMSIDPSARLQQPPVVLVVSDASRRKNVARAIEAFAQVRSHIPLSTLRLVGDGLDDLSHTARWARDTGLAEDVTFLGRLDRDHLAAEFSKASVFCHPSLEESQGMSLLEAMRAGLPVVAGRNSGAVAWTLFDGDAGLLVDVTNVDQIARGIIQCLRDPAAGRPAGERVMQMLDARFGADAVSSAYINIYEQLVGTKEHLGEGGACHRSRIE